MTIEQGGQTESKAWIEIDGSGTITISQTFDSSEVGEHTFTLRGTLDDSDTNSVTIDFTVYIVDLVP